MGLLPVTDPSVGIGDGGTDGSSRSRASGRPKIKKAAAVKGILDLGAGGIALEVTIAGGIAVGEAPGILDVGVAPVGKAAVTGKKDLFFRKSIIGFYSRRRRHICKIGLSRQGLIEAVSYTHLDVYKRQA